jgi:hypothetical protein
MQPEAVVLNKPMDYVQATLANGVKCGDTFRNMTRLGWPSYIDMTGRVLDRHVYVDTRENNGYLLPAHDEVTRVVENSDTVRLGVAGRRILGFAINEDEPERTLLLLDAGGDPDNPGAEECMILATGWPRLSPQWARDDRAAEGVMVTELESTEVLNPTFVAVLKTWRLLP